MLAFNHEAFHAVSAKCKGQNSKHKHAYPMGVAKLLANCIAMALISLGDKTPEETLRQLKSTSLKSLQQMKAATGVQPKASRIPPLVPTFKARIKLQAMTTVLPDFQLYQKCRDDIKLDAPSNPILPEGSKLLSIQPAKTSSDEGGGDQSLPPPIVLGKTADKNEDHCEQLVQTWGSPWSPLEFVKQAVKAGHPSQLDACLPMRLKLLSQKFRVVPLLERCRHRIHKTKFWMDRMAVLKSQEKILKASMRKDVRLVLADKNILLWKEMLQSINYEDTGVAEEFTSGTALVGSAPITGLWPAKFTPATLSISELHKAIPMDPAMVETVWEQTLAEVHSGFLIGPIELDQVPHHIPLSKRFGIKQGAKTRCVDDFSRSGINGCAQVSESPKPDTVDIIASLGLSLMRHRPAGASWKVRTCDLSGAYRQCAVHPDSLQFSYMLVAVPGEDRSVAFQMRALPFGSVRSAHAFLRVAHSLWAIATSEFLVPWTNYFDDFVTFSESNEQVSVDASNQISFEVTWLEIRRVWRQGSSLRWVCQRSWCFNRCIFNGWRKHSNWQYCEPEVGDLFSDIFGHWRWSASLCWCA